VSLLVATTVLLSVLAAGRVAERRRIEEQHAAAAAVAVQKLADDFEHQFRQLAEDARLLAELFWQTGEDPLYPAAVRAKVLRDGVRATLAAVDHFRGIAISKDGKHFDLALDPSESKALGPWLLEQAPKLVSGAPSSVRLFGPWRAPDDRSFFVQAQNLPGGVVVAAADAHRLFESMQHARPPDSRFLLVDSRETLWVGCASFATCQAIPRQEWTSDPDMRAFMATRAADSGAAAIPEKLRQRLALPARLDVAAHWHTVETDGEALVLGLLTSRSELHARRQVEHWRLLAIGTAILLSAALVGIFLWRQRHREWDLALRLRHAEEVNLLEHRLVRAEKLATLGVLSAGLAHELGTPLAIIRGRAEMLAERTGLPEIKTILDQSDHISNTLRQVLDFSREQPVTVQATDILAIARTVAGLLDFRLRAKNLHLRVDPPEGSLLVAADPDQLQQVVVNLVLNACDACATGGRISVRAFGEQGSPGLVRLDVTDDGCGIPTDKLDAVFDPFYTTKPKGEGTGLGLPVAASIVRNHRGQISISSSVGSGTTVTVLWPTERGDEA
jgi:signal transduction histidine kinase